MKSPEPHSDVAVPPPPPPPPPPPVEPQRKRTATQRSPQPKRVQPRRPQKRASGIKRALLIIFLILLVIVLMTPFLRDALISWLNPLSYRTFPKSVEFTVRRDITITSVSSYTVDVPRPPNISGGIQEVLSIGSNPSPSQVQKYGGTWMVWQGSGNAYIETTYQIRTETVWWDLDESEVLTVSDAGKTDGTFVSLSNQYNHDEWRLVYENTYVESLARQVASGNLTVYEIAHRVFEYLDTHISYSSSRTGQVKYPMETLQDGTGDCDDMSFLFVSMLRSLGVPSWVELGAMLNSLTNEWVGHAWLELYVPTRSGGEYVTIDMANDEFFVRGANRFSEWKSDGNGSHLQDFYYPYSYVSSPPGTASIGDTFTTVDYSADGTVVVKLGNDGGAIPGFEILLLPFALLMAFGIARHTRRK